MQTTNTPLSPREEQVLALIARGRSNTEIATELGISFNTVKAHVEHILAKLGVDSREEAARWWDAQRMAPQPSVFARWVRALGRLPWPRIGMAAGLGALAVAAVSVAALVVVALPSDENGERVDSQTTEESTVSPTAIASAVTATPTATEQATPSSPPLPTPVPAGLVLPTPEGIVVGQPVTAPVRTVTHSRAQASPFTEPWDGQSTVIYDFLTGEAHDFGPGRRAEFSPDGTMAAWVSGDRATLEGGEAWLLHLDTLERASLGPATGVFFAEDSRVVLYTTEGKAWQYDIASGEKTPLATIPNPWRSAEFALDVPVVPASSNDMDATPPWLYYAARPDGELIVEFEASAFAAIDETHLAFATPDGDGLASLFILDTATGTAEYVASFAAADGEEISIDGDDRTIAWATGYCAAQSPGSVYIFDRQSGTLSNVVVDGLRFVTLARDGTIELGWFGAWGVLNPGALELVRALPEGASFGVWSPEHRYASVGQVPGKDGVCM